VYNINGNQNTLAHKKDIGKSYNTYEKTISISNKYITIYSLTFQVKYLYYLEPRVKLS